MAGGFEEIARRTPVVRRVINRGQWMFTRIDSALLRRTGRSIGGRVARAPTLILTTTGRRSGQPRSTPLVYARDGDSFLVVAAYGGSPWNPHWLANLRDEPHVVIEVGRRRSAALATEIEGEERTTLWPILCTQIKSVPAAEARTDRAIPVVRLSPAPV